MTALLVVVVSLWSILIGAAGLYLQLRIIERLES